MGSSAQPESMAQMLQTIVGLGNLQESKRANRAQEAQRKEQITQEAQRLGIDENDKRFGQVQTLLKNISDHSATAADSIEELAKLTGMSAPIVEQLKRFALTAPQTADAIRNQAAANGMNAMSPQQQAPMNAQAASVATTGMNTGQAAQAGLLQQIAQAGQGVMGQPGVTQAAGTGMVGAMSQPMQGATSLAGAMTPGLPGQAAQIAAGTMPNAGEQLNAGMTQRGQDIQRTIANSQQQIELAQMQVKTGLNPQEILKGLTDLGAAAAQADDPKLDESTRKLAWARYNTIAKYLGQDQLMTSDPSQGQVGKVKAFLQQHNLIPRTDPNTTPGGVINQIGPMPPTGRP